MTRNPADVDLVKSGADDPFAMPPRRAPFVAMLIVGVLVLALGIGYIVKRRSAVTPQSVPVRSETVNPSATSAEQLPLPPLDESDAFVRDLVARLSSHPTVAAWLTTDGLIVNFVVVTTRIAQGESPSSELKAVGPVAPFQTRAVKGRTFVDPSSYRRYDRYADAVAALDAAGTARLYETLKPRIREAHRRFGATDEQADRVLERAIVELLKVPIPHGDVELTPAGVGYAFADERLEQLTSAQKQLLRMGPENMKKVQDKLREIGGHLGIEATKLTAPTSD